MKVAYILGFSENTTGKDDDDCPPLERMCLLFPDVTRGRSRTGSRTAVTLPSRRLASQPTKIMAYLLLHASHL